MSPHAGSQTIKVNRTKDFIERVGWTALQAAGGLLLSWLETGHVVIWQALLQAAGLAALKVILAQQVGNRGSGDAIPGGIEAKK